MEAKPDNTPADAGSRSLGELRQAIEGIDRELLDLFARRMAVAREVAKVKASSGAPVFDPQREDEVVRIALDRVDARDAIRAETLLRSLMRLSRGAQYEKLIEVGQTFKLGDAIETAPRRLPDLKRIVYQGSAGSYASLAGQKLFPGVPAAAAPTWDEACRRVVDGEADLAVLPLENTTAGTVDEVYDLIVKNNLYIWRSLSLPIQHCLLGLPGSTIEDIRVVVSHPQALSQCSDLIRARGWAIRESLNTAFAAAETASQADRSLAAIASESAAADSGLEILSREICNSRVNQTRFVAVGRTMQITPDADRISLALRLPHRSGSLAATLAVFGDRGLNLSKIESRPDLDNPWTYLFYLDFESPGERKPQALATLLQLSREMPMLRLLGWYHEE
jgi:chorismate mutase / prephenate dehydratase